MRWWGSEQLFEVAGSRVGSVECLQPPQSSLPPAPAGNTSPNAAARSSSGRGGAGRGGAGQGGAWGGAAQSIHHILSPYTDFKCRYYSASEMYILVMGRPRSFWNWKNKSFIFTRSGKSKETFQEQITSLSYSLKLVGQRIKVKLQNGFISYLVNNRRCLHYFSANYYQNFGVQYTIAIFNPLLRMRYKNIYFASV